jgi:3'-phosphoadenosine 5'-phosphosulfate sulfotransferase (PAPS reductase)/FAD synthetase
MAKLTVLSFGGGQDSYAILLKLLNDKAYRKKYAPEELIVLMSDTGNEHDETYILVEKAKTLCWDNGVEFELISNKSSYFPNSWKGGLIDFYERGNRVGSKCFPKTCTDNLKIKPIYNFLDRYIYHKYGMTKYGRKQAIKEFAVKYGKIDVLIGIARKEEKRASSNEESIHKWMQSSINKVYPLIEEGLDRQGCQDYIVSVGQEVPLPSNCILCPFMSLQELLYLSRVMPKWYKKWVQIEQNKIDANTHVGPDKNMGVWGKDLLPKILIKAKLKYGYMTDEELFEYKMSHGHCVKSKY